METGAASGLPLLRLACAFVGLLAAMLPLPASAAAHRAAPESHAAAPATPARSESLRAAQPYLRNPSSLPATAFPQADVLELYHLRFEQVASDGLTRQLIQRVFAIRSVLGARVFGAGDFWYDSSRWSFHLLRGEVIAPDGQRTQVTDGGDANPDDTGNRARLLHFPALRPGDRVNVVYTLTPAAAASWRPLGYGYIGDLFAFRGNYPVARVRYVLRSRLRVATDAVRVASIQTGRQDGQYVWDWSGGPLRAFWREPDGPSITDQSPYVQTGEFARWNGLARWYSRQLSSLAPLTPAFRSRLRRLVPPQATPQATVRAVWHYLSRHLEYWSDETGLHGFLPAPPPATLQAGRGDCKDGALLMSTWLRADGVPADVALIRTWGMGAVASGAATMAAFDHAIVYVPGLNLWLDTTAPSLHAGELPATDQGALALIVRPSQTGLVQVPILPAEANKAVQTFSLSSAGSHNWRLDGTIMTVGIRANRLRETYGSAADRRDQVAAWLRRRFPRATVLATQFTGRKWADGHAELTFTATIPRAELPHPAQQPPAMFRHHFARRYASMRQRRQAERIPTRWVLETRWSIPVARCSWPPSNSIISAFGQLRIQRSCEQHRLQTIFTLAQTATTVPKGQYARYRAFWRTVDLRLSQPFGPAPAGANTVLASASRPAEPPSGGTVTADAAGGRYAESAPATPAPSGWH